MCTAYLDDDLIDRARAAGVEHLVAKDRTSRLPALIKEVVGAPPWPTPRTTSHVRTAGLPGTGVAGKTDDALRTALSHVRPPALR